MTRVRHIEKGFVSAAYAAELIGCTRRHVARLIAAAKLPGAQKATEQDNSPFVIPLESVQAYITEQKKRGATKRAAPR
jgi:hypothetical protein